MALCNYATAKLSFTITSRGNPQKLSTALPSEYLLRKGHHLNQDKTYGKTVVYKTKKPTFFLCRASEESEKFVTEEEKEAWERRKSEASEEVASSIGGWEWTLNWNFITSNLIVGSCPRSAADVDTLVDQAGVTAILNLQSDVCFEALKIPAEEIRSQALERGVYFERVPTLDFNKGDQAFMLPEAVRMLNMLLSRGFTVYCHCTAGINRATLAALGYLTFVQGMPLKDGVALIKEARPIAHPYLECWKDVQNKLLEGRDEELTSLAVEVYSKRCAGGVHGNATTDWEEAQSTAISRSFQRWLDVDMLALDIERTLQKKQVEEESAELKRRVVEQEANQEVLKRQLAAAQEQTDALQALLEISQGQLAHTQGLLAQTQNQLATSQSQLSTAQSDLAAVLSQMVSLQRPSVDGKGSGGERNADKKDFEQVNTDSLDSVRLEVEVEAGPSADAESASPEDDLECDVITRTCKSAESAEIESDHLESSSRNGVATGASETNGNALAPQ